MRPAGAVDFAAVRNDHRIGYLLQVILGVQVTIMTQNSFPKLCNNICISQMLNCPQTMVFSARMQIIGQLDYKCPQVITNNQMINQLRKIVAGPKNRTVFQDFDLDLTYISQTIVAMAFPASGIEQTYRNSIHDVSKYLETKHPEGYLIINVSNRKYDYSILKNNVKEYPWQDHQAPTLDVLFEVCRDSFEFLVMNSNRVVCFHCNHGKGRTGSAIIALFMYSGFFRDVEEAVRFYNKKRFSSDNYGVSQPCQIRYIDYFAQAMRQIESKQFDTRVRVYQLRRISFQGLQPNEYEVNIYSTRSQKLKYSKIVLADHSSTITSSPLINDLYIEVMRKGWMVDKIVARANVNLNFMEKLGEKDLHWQMCGSEVRLSNGQEQNFKIDFYFNFYCQCHETSEKQCPCREEREIQQKAMQKIAQLSRIPSQYSSRQICKMLFPQQVQEDQQQPSKKQ